MRPQRGTRSVQYRNAAVSMKSPDYLFNGFRLSAAARALHRDGEPVALPPRAFACLLLLVGQRERAVGREELVRALWRHGAASDVQLGQLILQCRRALGDDGQSQKVIRTVAGFGYQWVAPTRLDPDSAAAADAPPARNADIPPPDSATISAPPLPAAATAGSDLAAADTDAATIPNNASPWRPVIVRKRLLSIIAVAVLAISAGALLYTRRSAPTAIDTRVIVLPLATTTGEDSWLRLGGMDLIAERLRRSGLVVQPSEQTVGLLNHLTPQQPAGEDAELLQALRRSAPGAVLVKARLDRRNDQWLAAADAQRGDTPAVHAEFAHATPTGALRGAADRLAAALGHMPPAADAATDDSGETRQRVQAALLANEPDAARAILLADPRQAQDQPRLRLQLAEIDIRAGRLDEARGTLDALLAAPGGDALLRAQLLAARGMIAVRSGQYAEAGRHFDEGITLIGDGGDNTLAGRLHNGRAVSRTSLENYAGALLDYGIARERFQRGGDEGGVARVDGNIGAMELLRAHPAQAEPYLVAAIQRFEALGLVQERLGQLQLLFTARRALLRNRAAWEAMDASWAGRARVPSQYSRLSMRLYRVEQLLQQGRHNEAAGLLDEPANDSRPADVAETERIHLLRAELEWRRGQPAAALRELAGVPLDPLPSADSDLIRADIELLRARIEREQQHSSPQTDTAAAATPPNARSPLRGAALANRLWAAGRFDAAAQAFAAAFSLAQSQGMPLSQVRVADDYVAFLIARGNSANAAVIANQVALWAADDYDAALIQLRIAHAQGRRDAWQAALDTARGLAGERVLPRALLTAP
jgi:DNA-binding winged helix-turn-helix (wHTH) protein